MKNQIQQYDVVIRRPFVPSTTLERVAAHEAELSANGDLVFYRPGADGARVVHCAFAAGTWVTVTNIPV